MDWEHPSLRLAPILIKHHVMAGKGDAVCLEMANFCDGDDLADVTSRLASDGYVFIRNFLPEDEVQEVITRCFVGFWRYCTTALEMILSCSAAAGTRFSRREPLSTFSLGPWRAHAKEHRLDSETGPSSCRACEAGA